MLPYVAIDESKIAPFHPFGVCCALAFFAWDWAIMRFAVRRGYDRADFRVLTILMGIFGWGFAYGVDSLFYHPTESLDSTIGAVKGLSSTGAIVGATIAAILWSRLYLHKKNAKWTITRRALPLLPISEVVVGTFPLGFAIGRIGCALIHDHVGKAATPGTLGSLFAVAFPRTLEDGTHHALGLVHVVFGGSEIRYDLGLLEMFLLFAIAVGFAATWRKNVTMGTYTIVAALVYGPFRFLLDFLRAEGSAQYGGEARIGGVLTFAQVWSLAVIALGLVLLARRRRGARAVVSMAAFLGIFFLARPSEANERWVDRPMTLHQLVFAGDVGLGVGHVPRFTGPGLNLEGALGVTEHLELGLRTGIRFGDYARAAQADSYGRTLWTETYGVAGDTVANPEFRVRWVAYSGSVAEVGLDGRMFIPVENGSNFGIMPGLALAFHLSDFVRIDTGVYVPIVFNDPVNTAFAIPGDFWFQISPKLWLGPMASLRFFRPGALRHNNDLLLGFGLGYQVANAIDLKTWILFPTVEDDIADRVGAGFGAQFRIGD